jgi:hypothetical protein
MRSRYIVAAVMTLLTGCERIDMGGCAQLSGPDRCRCLSKNYDNLYNGHDLKIIIECFVSNSQPVQQGLPR